MITKEDLDNLYAEQEDANINPNDSVRGASQMMRVNDSTRMGMSARLVQLFIDKAEADALETIEKMTNKD